MTNVCVVGASGFGAIHVRELLRAGAVVSGIVGRSAKTAQVTAAALSTRFGKTISAYASLEAAIADEPDGVIVSCAPEAHAEILQAAWHPRTRFLCEKPLFWQQDLDLPSLESLTQNLQQRIGNRLAFNCNNLFFLEATHVARCEKLEFEFFSHGSHRNADIAIDMLPHAIAFAQRLAPAPLKLQKVTRAIEEKAVRFECVFDAMHCVFSFRQDPLRPKHLGFSLDGKRWVRRQDDTSGTLRIFLCGPDGDVEMEDPMSKTARNFLHFLEQNDNSLPDFAFAAENLTLSWQLLNA